MKRIRKRLTALLLSCFLAFSGISGSYQTAQAAEIVAGYTIGQILESILLSFGISIFTTEMIQKGTSATWWDTDGSAALKPYYDDLEQAYEEQRFKVINGGGGQNPEPSPTPAPGTTPIPFPTTVPVAGDIPTFQELVAPALAGTAAFINMTQGAWECMAEAVSSLWNKMLGRADNVDTTLTSDDVNLILGSGYRYYVVYDYEFSSKQISHQIYLLSAGSYMYGRNLFSYEGKYYADGNYRFDVPNTMVNLSIDGISNILTNMPVFSNYNDAYDWANQQKINADKYVKENIWVHPDLQDTYKNNGKLEYPQQAQQPLQIPSGDQLADLSKKLNPEINTEFSPEMAPNYIQELIQQLQKGLNPDPNPDPDPNPNPNPNPDPNPNPNPDPDPDPEPNPTGSPDPEPTKAPEEDSSSDVDPKDYAIDLRQIFPFCIPFDLIHLLNVLDAEPEAPRFEIPIDLEADNPFTGKKIVDYHSKIVIDMSDYEQPIKVIRIFEVMFFILALLLITRDQMIKG